jgi:hypothetical protein
MSTGPSAEEAIPHDTPAVASSPYVLPGDYTARITVDGKSQSEPFKIVMDPRVKTPMAELITQFTLSKAIYDDALRATTALHEITVLRGQLEAKGTAPAPPAPDSIEAKLTKIAGGREGTGGRGGGGGGRGGPGGPANLTMLRLQLARMEHTVQSADLPPTTAQVEAYNAMKKPFNDLLDQWNTIKATDLKTMNDDRRKRGLPMLTLNTFFLDHNVEDQIELSDEP